MADKFLASVKEDLEKVDNPAVLKQILGTANPKGYRYVKASGLLKNSDSDWKHFANSL